MESTPYLFNVIILLSLLFVARSDYDDYNCVYTFYIKTGSIIKAGTDSKINLELWNKQGDGIRVTDVEKWGGLMGSKHDYFERGNLDLFSGRGPCLRGPVCALKVVSDGAGSYSGWYLNYIEVTTTGPYSGCAKQKFDVEQWLALDASPYELFAERDYCPYTGPNKSGPTNLRSILSS
ncbi:PLAT domain-containing protein 3-like [Silene latifolia]|uniref:PLAT domain-containing protein 3-like n=1 Tax=Silene latifolia TaxID=37657 RepID=UPI003D77D916